MSELIWVVGASTGIGYELTRQLLRDGHKVIASARRMETIEELQSEHPTHLLPLTLDICDNEATAKACAQLLVDDKLPDRIVVCAGTYFPVTAEKVTEAAISKVMDVNFYGAVRITEHMLPHMREQGSGHLVYVSSIAGYIGLPKALAYGPSKAALINFAEGMRIELAGSNIKVQVVNPGFVKTPLTAQNKFKMPFLMDVEDAAKRIREGMEKRQFEIKFPKRFTYMLRTIQMMPYALSLKILSARTKE